jgi:TolA-binding protein
MKGRARLLGAMAIAWAAVAPLRAQTAATNGTFSFAQQLFREGDYYRAITEYKRFVFLNPGHPLVPEAEYQTAVCCFRGEKWDEARQRFRALSVRLGRREPGPRAAWMLGETCYRQGDYAAAAQAFGALATNTTAGPLLDSARLRLAWCGLMQGQTAPAVAALNGWPTNTSSSAQAQGLAREIRRYEELPTRSPGLAAGLSAVLPGAGQLYIERPRDAAISFLFNAALIGAAVAAFHNDEEVLGGGICVVEAGWYVGNIYNAASGAHKFNRDRRRMFLDDLKLIYDVPEPGPGDSTRSLGIGWSAGF